MKDYIEKLRAKPENVRKTIAISASGAITAVVAIGWVIALFMTGSLSLAPITPDSDTAATFAESTARYNQMAGAASAFSSQMKGEGAVTIVEEDRSSTLDRTEAKQTDETVIHF